MKYGIPFYGSIFSLDEEREGMNSQYAFINLLSSIIFRKFITAVYISYLEVLLGKNSPISTMNPFFIEYYLDSLMNYSNLFMNYLLLNSTPSIITTPNC